jgi:hypothetical protein
MLDECAWTAKRELDVAIVESSTVTTLGKAGGGVGKGRPWSLLCQNVDQNLITKAHRNPYSAQTTGSTDPDRRPHLLQIRLLAQRPRVRLRRVILRNHHEQNGSRSTSRLGLVHQCSDQR